ncbi:MAG TPA: VOC family protein [Kouleothrix sp.]|uniref:VOC family protein n=1 Tax=Kouleothrix sp. TaxID=2779161 RepID=UPI002CC477D5|nr:VOC family protein [Kouleothrix sp.]
MQSSYKPHGYTSVAPYLIVDGASRTIEFVLRVFGAIELRRFLHPDGRIMHAEVRIDDTVVMLADGAAGWSPLPAHIHVYVPDVDITYQRALEAGATSVQEPVQKQDEDKRGGVKDAAGTTWWLATKID